LLFFIQAAAWPSGSCRSARFSTRTGCIAIKPYGLGLLRRGRVISPLAFGAMADRHVPPAKVLRGLALASSILMAGISTALKYQCNPVARPRLDPGFLFTYSPMFSITTALVLAGCRTPKRNSAPSARSRPSAGWRARCSSAPLSLDRSAYAGYLGALVWLLVAIFTFFLPALEIPKSAEHLSWHERLGLDALTLLKRPAHAGRLSSPPRCSISPSPPFYPYAPTHLHDLGFTRTSAWMSLAQVTEIIAMFSLAWLLVNWRLKWIFACGIASAWRGSR